MKQLVIYLNTKYISALCIVLAVACRLVNVLFVSYAGRDKMFLVLQSKSLLEGKGLGVPQYYTANPELAVYDYTPMWPPGYPVLLTPLLKFFKYDVYWSTTSLDIIFCLALIFFVRKICSQLQFSIAATNIMTLIAGCFEYPFINESLPTDTAALVLFLAAVYLIIRLVTTPGFRFSAVVAAAVFLFLPCLFRYNYPPVSLAVPLSLLVAGFLNKDVLLKKKSAWLFLLNAAFTLVFFIVLKLITGYAGYATPTVRGIYPENILHWYPAVPASFINPGFLTSQLIRLTGTAFTFWLHLLEIINVVLLLALLILFARYFIIKKNYLPFSPISIFVFTGTVASAALFLLLGYFSFTYSVQHGYISNWNYVAEARYFAFLLVFLQLLFIAWLFLPAKKTLPLKIIAMAGSLALFTEITHNLYFYSKVALRFTTYKAAVYREQDYVYFNNLVKKLQQDQPEKQLLATAPGDQFYSYAASYYGHKGLADSKNLLTGLPRVNKNSTLVVMLYDNEVLLYDSFLKTTNARLLKKIQYSNFYLVELNP
jgi:hypothetical protein